MISTEQLLQSIKRSVNNSTPGATIILYGSYARGDFNSDSDIDLLILLDKETITFQDRTKISYPLYDIQYDNGVVISPIVCSRNVWNTSYHATPFFENVAAEGVVL